MSRRSAGDEMMEGIAGGCIVAIFLALWTAIVGLIIAIVKVVQTSPEDQLRKMGAQQVYGAQIVGQPCPSCEEPNEETAMFCFHCGSSMTQTRNLSTILNSEFVEPLYAEYEKLAAKPSYITKGETFKNNEIWIAKMVVVVTIICMVLILLIFLFFLK